MADFLIGLDGGTLLFIQEYIRHPALTPFVKFITNLGNAGIFWIAVSLLLLVPKKTRKIGCMSFMALFVSLLINNLMLKNLVGRMRPYDCISSLTRLIPQQVDYSFPSGHTGSSFASAYVLYKGLPKKAGIAAVALAALIGLSRLYVGVHYPSDVLVGLFTGLASGYISVRIYHTYLEKRFV